METPEYTKLDLSRARREERKAESDMSLKQSQADEQKEQLETLLDYRDECVEGLRTAKQSGLTIVQIREYQLLMQHLSVVVEEQQGKVDISQVNYDESKAVWQGKHDIANEIQLYCDEHDELLGEEYVDDDTHEQIQGGRKKDLEIIGKKLKAGSR